MPSLSHDRRSPQRRSDDEQIASEPMFPPPELPPDTMPRPLESHSAAQRRPLALAGVVENGVIRILDPGVSQPEHTRVIVVTSER